MPRVTSSWLHLRADCELEGGARDAAGDSSTEIIRIEQLYPFPAEPLVKRLQAMPKLEELVWAQEESQNMGGWTFVAPRLQELMGFPFQYVGRDASASPATGSHRVHDREQAELVEAAIGVGAALPHLVSAHPARPEPAVAAVQQGVR